MDEAFSGFQRRARFVMVVPALCVVVIAVVLGAVWGGIVSSITIAIGAIVALAVVWRLTVQRGATTLLTTAGRTSTAMPAAARVRNLLEGLCVSNGLNLPSLEIVDDPALNAAVVATQREATTLIVTSGLVESLDRIELEGVIAALLVRVRTGEAVVSGRLTMWLARPRPVSGNARRRRAPFARRFIAWAVGDQLFAAIDEQACQMTRYPPGLIAAYEKMVARGTVTSSALADAPHLWIMPPANEDSAQPETTRRGVHPPLAERLTHLREL